MLAAVAPFKDFQAAVDATVAIMQSGLPVARIEFLDDRMVDACNHFSKMQLDVAPTLFFEFNGSKQNTEAQRELAGMCFSERYNSAEGKDIFEKMLLCVEETCKSYDCLKFNSATDIDKRNELWKARHNAWYAAHAVRPGSKVSSREIFMIISYIQQ